MPAMENARACCSKTPSSSLVKWNFETLIVLRRDPKEICVAKYTPISRRSLPSCLEAVALHDAMVSGLPTIRELSRRGSNWDAKLVTSTERMIIRH